jgi:Ca-activated chloride channel family protein
MLSDWNILPWEYNFMSPWWFLMFMILPGIVYLVLANEKNRSGDYKFTGTEIQQQNLTQNWIGYLRYGILALQLFAVVLLILAAAQPVSVNNKTAKEKRYQEGIDIVIALDISTSMLAMDFEPNRLEASKQLAKEFIDTREGDRIGLVVYSGEAYTACPPTLDYNILKNQIDHLDKINLQDGTAIGTGLGTAVTRLRNDSLPTKVVVLLTDGSNNAGDIDPATAAELAKAKNIRVYTIGVGTNGEAPTPVSITPFGIHYEKKPVEIDEETLKNIADITGGQYFRATDNEGLKSIYNEIDKLEKGKISSTIYKNNIEANPEAFLNWSLVLLLISWLSNRLLFRLEA